MIKNLLLSSLLLLTVSVLNAQDTWLKTFGSTEFDYMHKVKTDDDGNVYVAGRMKKDLLLGDTTIVKVGSASNYNYYLIKFDGAGKRSWVSTFTLGSTSSYELSGLAIDKSKNVYLSTFDGGYYVKFNSLGVKIFEKYIPASNARIGNIEVDEKDNVWLGCSFSQNPFSFDGLPVMNPNGNAMMFIARLDSTGKAKLTIPFAGNSSISNRIGKIALQDSFVYVTANTQFNILVGTDSVKNCDMLLAKFGQTGEYKWAKGISGPQGGINHLTNLAVSKYHQAVITGRYDDPLTMGSVTLGNSTGKEAMFLVSYDKDGNLQWAKGSSSIYTSGHALTFTPENKIAVGTDYNFSFSYGGITVGDGVSNKRYAVLMEADSLGNPLWIKALGQKDWLYGEDLAVDKNGNWFFAGQYQTTGAGTNEIDGKTIQGIGISDLYLIKNFFVPEPTASNASFCKENKTKQLTALGAGVRWYSDSALTQLVHMGSPFPISTDTTTTYYVVQKAAGALSKAKVVTAIVHPAIKVTLSLSVPQISAAPNTGISYKWYIDGVLEQGLQNAVITPQKNGKYHVKLTDANNCEHTSDTLSYIYTSIQSAETGFTIYPNPAHEYIEIDAKEIQIKNISLLSVEGKVVKNWSAGTTGKLFVGDLANGVYLLSVQTDKGNMLKKLVIGD